MKKLYTLFICTILLLLIGSPAQAAVLEVRPSAGGIGTLGDVYPSIQAAIDDADPGDTILIHDGTYDEAMDIDGKINLTLQGESKENTIIKSSSVISWAIPGYPQYDGRMTVVRIYDSNVITIENMTFDCDDMKGNNRFCISGWDSEVTVDNCILKNMSVDDLSGGYYELISYFRAPGYDDTSRAAVTFTANTFIEPGRVGIVTHDYIDATISGNTFYKITDDFGYAIEVGSQSVGQITGNTIYGYDTPAASDGSESAGIYVENCFTGTAFGGSPHVDKGVLVQGNEIYDCQYAMWIGNGYSTYAGDVDITVTLTGNNFHDNVQGGLIIQDEDAEDGSSVTVNGSGNTVVDNNEVGLWIFTQGDGDITVNLTGETISGNDDGIYVADYAGGTSGSSYNVAVNGSKINGNGSYGIENAVPTIVVDAENNWWGDATGPYDGSDDTGTGGLYNPGGLGDSVTDYVDYEPWYTSSGMESPVIVYVGDTNNIRAYADTIQAGIDAAYAGDTVEVSAGTYNENITIDKSLIVVSVDGAELTIINAQEAEFAVLINGAETVATFDGFTVENYDTAGILAGAFRDVLEGVPLGDDPVEVHILNNIVKPPTIEEPHNNNVQVGAGTTGTIIGNEVFGAFLESPDWTGSGILVAGSSNVEISNNYAHDCESGIVIVGYGEYRDAPAVNNLVLNNLVENSGCGISVQMKSIDTIVRYNDVMDNNEGIAVMAIDYSWEHSAPSGTEIHCNKVVGNTEYGVLSSVWVSDGIVSAEQVDATYNWWGDATGPSGQGGGTGDVVSENVEFFPWLYSVDCNDYTIMEADYVVDDDWSELPDFSQILINSTYYYISINAFDDIQEAVDATTDGNNIYVYDGNYSPFTVDGKANLTITASSNPIVEGVQSVTTNYGPRDCVVFVNNSVNIVLNMLDIQGNGLGTINTKNYGVIYQSSSGSVKGCAVSPNTSGDMSSTAIGIWDGSDVMVVTTLMENYGRLGILIYNGTNAQILDNEIVGQVYDGEGEVCYGIEVEGGYNDDNPATASNVVIKRNEIYDCDNTFEPEPSWGSSGIYVNGWMAYYPEADSTVTIVDNVIHDNYEGIYVVNSPSSRANFNSIYNNRTAGVTCAAAADDSNSVFDAEYNWWGDISGPNDNDPNGTIETDGSTICPDVEEIKNADGLGNKVTENVLYCPWLLAPISSSAYPCPLGDLDGDCDVDFADLAKLANNWLVGTEE